VWASGDLIGACACMLHVSVCVHARACTGVCGCFYESCGGGSGRVEGGGWGRRGVMLVLMCL